MRSELAETNIDEAPTLERAAKDPRFPAGKDGKCVVYDKTTGQKRRVWPVDGLEQVESGQATLKPIIEAQPKQRSIA